MKKGRDYLGRRLPNFMDSGADDDIFLSLEEEAPVAKQPRVPKKAPRARKESPRKTNKPEPEAVLDAEVLDTSLVQQATGTYELGWPLLGMDCPDCASKATRALDTLHQANDIMSLQQQERFASKSIWSTGM